MNEISRCCRVLGVKHGASLEELKKAYRDLVQVWHPDRFSSNEGLQIKAQEQLKEVNLAYEYLVANAFQDGFLVEPAEAALMVSPATEGQASSGPSLSEATASREQSSDWPDEEAEIQEEAAPRNAFWALVGVATVLVGCSVLLYVRIHGRGQNSVPTRAHNDAVASSSQSADNTNPVVEQAGAPTAKPAPESPSGSAFPCSKDILAGMTTTNGGDWLQTTHLLSPPFAMRVKVKLTDLADLRLYYALGRVIFNWSDHPKEMRVHDPRNWTLTPVPDQGILLPNESHELLWEITKNGMSVSADGHVRFQTQGDYEGIKGSPGIGPTQSSVIVKSFTLETPRPLEDPPAPTRDHGPVAGDMLSSMIPEKNVRVANEQDGLALRMAGGPGNRLMSSQAFRPPFVIRTRAKTDGLNLRLYCGAGEIIFNWEYNPQELRVHDPLSGQPTPVPGKGQISPNEWHALIWEIQNTGMRLFVDGKLRFQNRRDYHTLEASPGIGPAMSKVTVDYFLVEKKQ
jgi:DnaJ-like protein